MDDTKSYMKMHSSIFDRHKQRQRGCGLLRLMKDKGRNLLCVRKSEVTNRDSTFAELISAINNMGVAAAWRATLNPLSLTCVNGNEIIFRGVNDDKQREKLKSITFKNGKLTDVRIEEATELNHDDFETTDNRLRGELPEGNSISLKYKNGDIIFLIGNRR